MFWNATCADSDKVVAPITRFRDRASTFARTVPTERPSANSERRLFCGARSGAGSAWLASPCCGHEEFRVRGAGSRFNTTTQGSIATSAWTLNPSELPCPNFCPLGPDHSARHSSCSRPFTVNGRTLRSGQEEGRSGCEWGRPGGLYEPWVREFEQSFPGIEVTLAADFSNILSPKIDRELADHKLSVDLTRIPDAPGL